MDMLIQVMLLILGFAMLVKGADWFVDGAAGVADRLGVPQLVIGLTIVAMGTSAPEAAVSITAALKGNADITIGNVLGSNILNILIILGIVSVIIATPVARSVVKIDLPFMIAITLILLFLGYTGNQVTRVEAIILLVIFAGYMFYLFKSAKKEEGNQKENSRKKSLQKENPQKENSRKKSLQKENPQEENSRKKSLQKENPQKENPQEEKTMWKLVVIALVGLVLIVLGSDFTVDSATKIATELGMGTRFIGLTIVALGTSLPELFTSVAAALKGKSDIAIGNIVGSNIFNVLFIVGLSATIIPITFAPNFIIDALVATVAGIILWVATYKAGKLTRPIGVIMLISYGFYFAYLLMS